MAAGPASCSDRGWSSSLFSDGAFLGVQCKVLGEESEGMDVELSRQPTLGDVPGESSVMRCSVNTQQLQVCIR